MPSESDPVITALFHCTDELGQYTSTLVPGKQ